MLIPVTYKGEDPSIPATFSIVIPDDVAWVTDFVNEILSMKYAIFHNPSQPKKLVTSTHRSLSIVTEGDMIIVTDHVPGFHASQPTIPTPRATRPLTVLDLERAKTPYGLQSVPQFSTLNRSPH